MAVVTLLKARYNLCRFENTIVISNPLTPELNPSAQRCLARFFTEDFNF
jgi:hypothetical protein